MRKRVKTLLIVLTVVFSAFLCTGCSFFEDDYLEKLTCTHEYDEGIVTTVPSCIKAGEKTVTCVKCGKEKTEKLEKLAHHYKVQDGQDATCTVDGWSTYSSCTVCGAIDGKMILPATGHTGVEIPAQAPTCTEPGYTASSYCSTCGEWLVHPTEISATGHTEVLVAGRPATCTDNGYTASSYCSTCDETLLESDTVLAVGAHTLNADGLCTTCGTDSAFAAKINAGHYAYTEYTGEDVMGKTIRFKWNQNNVSIDVDVSDNEGFIISPGTPNYESYRYYSGYLCFDGVVNSRFRRCAIGTESYPQLTTNADMSIAFIGEYLYFQFPKVLNFSQCFDYWGEIWFFSNGTISEEFRDGVEIVSELYTVSSSSSNTANVLTDNGNGTYNYTFAGVGDFVHNTAVEIGVGETLVCDFTLSTPTIDETGWFGVCFGDEGYTDAGIVTYPHSSYWMINYDKWASRLYCVTQTPVISESELKMSNVVLTDTSYDYRITLRQDEDGTYTYSLSRKASTDTAYTLIHERADIACPTPSCLMLTSVYNTFTLQNLCFYKV